MSASQRAAAASRPAVIAPADVDRGVELFQCVGVDDGSLERAVDRRLRGVPIDRASIRIGTTSATTATTTTTPMT